MSEHDSETGDVVTVVVDGDTVRIVAIVDGVESMSGPVTVPEARRRLRRLMPELFA